MVDLSADVVNICVIRWPKASMVVDLGTENGAEFGPKKGSGRKAGRRVLEISGKVMKSDSTECEAWMTANPNITEPDCRSSGTVCGPHESKY